MKIEEAIHKVVNSPEVKAIVKELRKDYDWWGWTQGGCYAFAEALVEAFPDATLWVIAEKEKESEDWPSHHAFVKYHGRFYDATGRRTRKDLKAPFTDCIVKIGEVENWPDKWPVWYPQQEFVSLEQIELITEKLRVA